MLAGGAVVCAPSFTPQSFWESIELRDVTWYYAAPTMHAQIVLYVEQLGFVPKNKVRYVANAAGGLPKHVAVQLMETFQCPILPSYGMTVTSFYGEAIKMLPNLLFDFLLSRYSL